MLPSSIEVAAFCEIDPNLQAIAKLNRNASKGKIYGVYINDGIHYTDNMLLEIHNLQMAI